MSRRRLALALLVLGCTDPAPSPPTVEPVVEPPPPVVAPPPERPEPTCTYHGWCWQHPLPQGNDLYGVWVGESRVVAVGERGTVLVREGESWALEDTPDREALRDVWSPEGQTLWAVGDLGRVLRRGDEGWERVEAPTERSLRSIRGRGPDEIYAVGEGGTILRWDGTRWAAEVSGTERLLTAVSVSDRVYVQAVDPGASEVDASSSLLVRADDGTWSEAASFDEDVPAMLAVSGSVFVAGADVRRGSPGGGERFNETRLPVNRPINALWGRSDTSLHAVGYGGRLARLDEGRWRRVDTGHERDLFAIHGTSSQAWAVGADGVMMRFDGERWTTISAGPDTHLKSVWGISQDDVWAVGDGASLHYDGSEWSPEGPTEHDLRAVWGAGSTLLAAGDAGALLRFEEGEWTFLHDGGDYELTGIWGADPAHAFVVGKTTWLEHEHGEWREHPERPPAASAWGDSRRSVWVAGREGLHRWNGREWTAVESTADMVLFGIWGSAHDDIWASGSGGRLLHFDGDAWREVDSPTQQNLLALFGTDADDIYAVGHHGTILHYDGHTWTWRDSGTDALLHSVWGTETDVFVVGHGGAVLHMSR